MIPPLVIDTNVVVSGLLTPDAGAPTAVLLDAMLTGGISFLLSTDLLAEYREVLLRPTIAKLHGLDPDAVDELLVQLTFYAVFCEDVENAESAGDSHLFALLAAEERARLVSGDAAVLRRAGVRGWSARDCVESIRGGRS